MFILSSDDPVKVDAAEKVGEFSGQYAAYLAYLTSVREKLPASVYDFATASWRQTDDHRSLHDAWVETLAILETSPGSRHEGRSLEIQVRLLGPYHDGHTTLIYRGVQSYTLETPFAFKHPPATLGHGDWLADEITVSANGLVQHEVEFSRGSRWRIECRDIECTWHPMS